MKSSIQEDPNDQIRESIQENYSLDQKGTTNRDSMQEEIQQDSSIICESQQIMESQLEKI